MAKIRAKTLTCPNCASAVPVRNVFKAKVVVCTSCDSQLDLTTPDFQVLGKLPDRQKPQDAICLGLKGELKDGRTFEIIGRIRFSDFDDEESWFWDEWLLLAQNGEYLWLSEDGKSYELHTRFIPDNPPDIDTLNSSKLLAVDGTEYRVKERGNPSISYVEGELTWRAKVGDIISYIDARGPGGGFGVEFTHDEIEFFKRQRLSRMEAYRLTGLQMLLDLESHRDELRAKYQKGPKAMGCGGFIMAGGAAMAFLLFVIFTAFGSKTGKGTMPVVEPTVLEAGVELGKANLVAGTDYMLSYDSIVEPATHKASLLLTDPKGKEHVVLKVDNLQKSGEADLLLSFQAEHTGPHTLKLRGTLATTPGLVTSASKSMRSIDWYVRSQPVHPEGFFFVGPLLLLGGLAFFLVSAGRTSAASARAAREYRKERRALIAQLHQDSRIQEG